MPIIEDEIFGNVSSDIVMAAGGPPLLVTSVTGPTPLIVNFTDQSTGAISWLWNFGPGEGSSEDTNPIHTYYQTGIYSVSLTVTNDDGSHTKTEYGAVTTTGPDSGGSGNPPYTLNIEINNPGPIPGGTVDQDGTSPYPAGEEIIIVAVPEYGYHFTEWTGPGQILNRSEAVTEITMNGNYNITAVFEYAGN